jgi:hypothetical protein
MISINRKQTMKKIFFYLLLFFASIRLHAQLAGSPNTYLNNYVQPSPNAAALGKYADYPVSYYTGTPGISVPIYELKDGPAKVPVSLSYHASGIRVAELASWVGLGWTLNSGGMIIRTVRGAPDEGSLKTYSNLALGPRGYYKDSGISKLPLLPYPVNGTVSSMPSQMVMQFYTIPGVASGALDCEPDLYTFNFSGYTGKFVFDENRTPRLLTDEDIRINVNYSGSSFTSWVITTPDGTKYLFGENNAIEITNPSSILSGTDPDSQAPSGWYLTRIIYPNTKDTVYFNYTAEGYSYYDLGPESKLYNFSAPGGGAPNTICDNSAIQQNMIKTTISTQRLTSIRSKNYSVVFVANNARQDLPSPYTYRQLDTVKIYAGTQCIDQYAFNYSYFQSGYGTQCYQCSAHNPSWPIDSSDTKRLKLLSVKNISGDGSISKPPYTFQYQDTFSLPRRLSYDQDHWGYSNNSSGGANPFFTPPVTYAGMCTYSYGANRNPKWPDMEAGTLLSIRDPLGVTTKFEFEANSADNSIPNNLVGGLRVKRILVTDSVTGIQTVRKFQYSGGVLFKIPTYLIKLQNEFYVPPTMGNTSGYQGYGYNSWIPGMLKQSQSMVPLQDAQGNHIGYTNVKEIFGNNGEGGSKVYTFVMNLNPHGSSRLSLYNYASQQTVNTIFYGSVTTIMGNGHFNDTLPQNLQYYSSFDVSLYYPYAPDQQDERRGKLLLEMTYDSAGNLLKSVSNNYQDNYHEWAPIRGFKVYNTPVTQTQNNSSIVGYVQQTNNALTYYKLHCGFSHLISSVETDYKDGKSMVITHNYGYEDTLHTMQTSDTSINSQGDSIIKKTYYSFDYSNTATSDNVFGKMKIRNLLLPVSTRVWKNNKLIAGTITQFQDFASSGSDTFINPSKIFSLETTNPLTSTQAGESIGWTGQFSSLIPDSYFIEKADFNYGGTTGRIIEQKLTSDKDQALVWDNNSLLPLAQVDNAYLADVAFSSFETAEPGNWTISTGAIVSDNTAPTGIYAYTLSSGSLSKSGLSSAKSYIVSYWLKTGATASVSGGSQSNALSGLVLNNWTYHEVTVTGTSSVSITGSGNIDEVRLYPANAQMNTYSYDGMLRLVSHAGVNSTISYYEYDSFNRLVDIKDQNGNIIKAFEYNYGRSSRPSQ